MRKPARKEGRNAQPLCPDRRPEVPAWTPSVQKGSAFTYTIIFKTTFASLMQARVPAIPAKRFFVTNFLFSRKAIRYYRFRF
jgi:hypothetical protein